MKNKQASLITNISYLIVFVIVVGLMLMVLYFYANNAAVFSDRYAKEIALLINQAQPGQTIQLDIHKLTQIARRNEVEYTDIASFDNVENKICIKLAKGSKTCYNYINNVDIINHEIKLVGDKTGTINILSFEIKEKARNQFAGEQNV